MNILLVNYRYFVSGGPERYMFNISDVFRNKGHNVIPYSVRNDLNNSSDYNKYFISPVGDGKQVYYHEIPKSPRNLVKLIGRNFYSFEAKRNISQLLDENKIDVAYILAYLRWISPSILGEISQRGIPIVVRLSDYHLLCSQVQFFRDGKPCELCKNGNFLHAIKYRCVQNSVPETLIDVMSRYFHKFTGVFNDVNAYVAPSAFLKQKLIEGGYHEAKIHHVPTFIDVNTVKPDFNGGPYFLYIGRIAEGKGLDTLITAWKVIIDSGRVPENIRLLIVGTSNRDVRAGLQERVKKENIKNVEFLDHQKRESLNKIIIGASCVVVPSEWYENFPNTILEAYAHGKPVIASRLGSLPEAVMHGETGLLFSPADPHDLAEKMGALLKNPQLAVTLGINARKYAEEYFGTDLHYGRLMSVFDKASQEIQKQEY